MASSDSSDRRKNPRIKIHREAVLVTPNGMHNIDDISMSGLSFRCSSGETFPSQWPVEIIFAGSALDIKDLPVRLVREEISEDGPEGNSEKKVGIEFLELDLHNQVLLDKLLVFHSHGSA